jgi:hypothetical protein
VQLCGSSPRKQEDKDIKEKIEVRNLLYATIAISDI